MASTNKGKLWTHPQLALSKFKILSTFVSIPCSKHKFNVIKSIIPYLSTEVRNASNTKIPIMTVEYYIQGLINFREMEFIWVNSCLQLPCSLDYNLWNLWPHSSQACLQFQVGNLLIGSLHYQTPIFYIPSTPSIQQNNVICAYFVHIYDSICILLLDVVQWPG